MRIARRDSHQPLRDVLNQVLAGELGLPQLIQRLGISGEAPQGLRDETAVVSFSALPQQGGNQAASRWSKASRRTWETRFVHGLLVVAVSLRKGDQSKTLVANTL